MERIAGRIMLLSGFKRALVAFFAGALAVVSLAPIDFFAVLFVSFPLLVWLLDGASGNADAGFFTRLKPAFWIGWWFGFGYFLAGLWWTGAALLVEADSFAWALPFAVVGLPAVLAVYYGLAAALARAVWSDGAGRIAALAVGFGLMEWLRGIVLTGFPWNAIGYGAMPVPLMMQSAHVVGLLGMNVLTVFVFSAPALIATRRGAFVGMAAALVLFAGHLGYGAYVLSTAPEPVREGPGKPVFRIVQPSIAQTARLDTAEGRRIFDEYLKLSAAAAKEGDAEPKYIVWPETAVPFILGENPEALTRIGKTLKPGQTLIAGAVRADRNEPDSPTRYSNSILVISDKGKIVAHADKVHLVPFGEYMPFEGVFTALGISPVAMPGGFTAGKQRTTLALTSSLVALPLVCYEVVFPGGIDAAGPKPTFLLNVTNDAWYGRTSGPYQHLRQARLRAVETGLPMIRAGDNGISVVTDSYGRIVTGIGLDGVGTVDATLGAVNPLKIPSIARDSVFWGLMLVLLIAALASRKSLTLNRN